MVGEVNMIDEQAGLVVSMTNRMLACLHACMVRGGSRQAHDALARYADQQYQLRVDHLSSADYESASALRKANAAEIDRIEQEFESKKKIDRLAARRLKVGFAASEQQRGEQGGPFTPNPAMRSTCRT